MKVTYIESPEGLFHQSPEWELLKQQILAEQTDILVTNEMPFGKWLSAQKIYDHDDAEDSIVAHEHGIEALKSLNIPLVLSSQPVRFEGMLANEAYVLENNNYYFAHQKQYFPEESGFYETTWFQAATAGFNVVRTEKITIGFLLCTELMFNEWAREYRRQGAHLIVAPRATGQSYYNWKIAASMAAIVSGCYVVSSNRVGKFDDDLIFGGKSFAFAPDGILISETTAESPVVSFELDFGKVESQQKEYPCYVKESYVKESYVKET